MERCDECDNRPGTASTTHADGCPNEQCRAFLMGNFDRVKVEVCVECSWKDGYHKPGCIVVATSRATH